ncbi:MAG: hypothetical protein JF886_15855 [Candidatus Dormibacteraeota bacterium]|uniref:Uncharacterized protein n=1 Tax=Candidatus Aeolococcus gillhamiae TaxID=3127015 RepID=A0A934K653_9BACT|nr:hypothetical protein [Candidatus Dormibacteraeota bacterium]
MVDPESVRVHNLAVGQVAEWLVWTRLVSTSGGDLHVFLPLDDRGIDGIVHRISTDAYARVQVKGRSVHRYRGIEIQVRDDELVDDRAVIVVVDIDLGAVQLGRHALVVDVPAFRELAHRHVNKADITYDAEVTLPPPPDSPWAQWCVPVEEMGDRLLAPAPVPALPGEEQAIASKRLGYRAEMELLRRAADSPSLNVFKAFPDLEPNEYLMYDIETRGLMGIQVKSVTFQHGASEAQVSVYRPALRPSPHTWFVIFLKPQKSTAFVGHCAVVPSQVVAEALASNEAHGKLAVTRELTGRMAPWRVELADLGARLVQLTVGV